MQTFTTKTRVDADGMLRLVLPVGMPDTTLEVVVVLQPLAGRMPAELAVAPGWPPGFLESIYSGWQGEPLEREVQETHA